MATTWTQDEIDAVRASIARGVLTVSFADRTVTYFSLKDLLSLLALMEGSATAEEGGTSTRFAATSKGLRGPGARRCWPSDWPS